MQEHMNEMERIDSGIRSMKHDMKNTISVITQLASKNGENTELQTYLSELNQTIGSLEFQFKTGNTVVDTLLNMKYHEAVREMPDLQMDADKLLFPETIQIQSYDIGVILGNALDNAIEACRKLKEKESNAKVFIRLSSYQKGKMVFIEIENSFDGNVIRKKQSEFPVTDKADKEAHGIGLLNMKHTAEKYHGAVDWSVKDNLFTLSVMMKNERS
jgi:sensor histidine kinase regulating citrate/malate metabolism